MPATPQSERLNALNVELARLLGRYQEAAVEADKPGHEEVFLSVCYRVGEGLHAARRAVRLLEVNGG